MSTARLGPPGTTRSCPHCKASILESANICPVCRHHLRFDRKNTENAHPTFSALRVEAAVRHPEAGEAWEYSVMVTIRNEKGEEITRHSVGVGALQPLEQRTFTVAVEVSTPEDRISGNGGARR